MQWLGTSLLAPVPHRQVMLTIPRQLHAYCLYCFRLLGEIARVAAHTVTAAIRTPTGGRDLAVGIVASLHAHGSRANWHPHRHLLVTDGGFRTDGTSMSWPAHDTACLTKAFRLDVRPREARLTPCRAKGAAVAGRPSDKRSRRAQAAPSVRRRRCATPITPSPAISIAQLAGSGTTLVLNRRLSTPNG